MKKYSPRSIIQKLNCKLFGDWSSCEYCMHCNKNIYYDWYHHAGKVYCRKEIGYYDKKDTEYAPLLCKEFVPRLGTIAHILWWGVVHKIRMKCVYWGWTFWTYEERVKKGRPLFTICLAEGYKQKLRDQMFESEVEFQLDEDGEINAHSIEEMKHPIEEWIDELNNKGVKK